MSVFRRSRDQETTPPPKAVMAAAMPLAGPGVNRTARLRSGGGQEDWQKEAWYFYDAVGELRAPVNWISNAVSKAEIYAAETDPETGLISGPTENAVAQQIAAAAMGGANRRAQLLYFTAVCWQVPGELFIVIRPRASRRGVVQPDEWLVLSGTKVWVKGGSWTYTDPMTGLDTQLGTSDRLIRVWSPHPNDQAKADTAVRPALPILREVEKSSMNISSRLDSRLASNGILPFPAEADFPTEDGQSKAASVMGFLMEAMEAALSQPGTAAAQVPIVVEMPGDMIQLWKDAHMDLSTAFDSTVVDLRDNDLSRLASTLDMPKDVAAGTQGDMNHWSAWQVEESTYKIFIEPLLERIGDAVTEHWYQPALRAAGVAGPEQYVLGWDTSSIVKRPDATEDLNWLYDHRLISDDYRRAESGIPDDAIPSDDELQRRLLVDVVTGAPTLAADPTIGRELFGFEVAPAAAGVAESDISGAPALDTPPPADSARALPERADSAPDGLVAAAELIVFDALSRAGGRLLTAQNRGQFTGTPKHELHTVIPAAHGDIDRLLGDSFLWVDRVAEAFGCESVALSNRLREHVRQCLWSRTPHSRDALRRALR